MLEMTLSSQDFDCKDRQTENQGLFLGHAWMSVNNFLDGWLQHIHAPTDLCILVLFVHRNRSSGIQIMRVCVRVYACDFCSVNNGLHRARSVRVSHVTNDYLAVAFTTVSHPCLVSASSQFLLPFILFISDAVL